MDIGRSNSSAEVTPIEAVQPAQHAQPTSTSNLGLRRKPKYLRLNLDAKKANTARSEQHRPRTPEYVSTKHNIIEFCKEILVITLLNRVRVLQLLGCRDEAAAVLMSAVGFSQHCSDDLKLKIDMWREWFSINIRSAGYQDPEAWRSAESFLSPQANFQHRRRASEPVIPVSACISSPAHADIKPPSRFADDPTIHANFDSPLYPYRKTVSRMAFDTPSRNTELFPPIPTPALRAAIEELDKQPTAVDRTVLWFKGVPVRKHRSRANGPDLSDLRPVVGHPKKEFTQMLQEIHRQNEQNRNKLARPVIDAHLHSSPDSKPTENPRSGSSLVDVDVTTISPLPVRRGSLDIHQSPSDEGETVTPLSTETPALSKLVSVKNANPSTSTSGYTTTSPTTAILRRLSQDSSRSPPSLTLQTSPSIHRAMNAVDHTLPLHHSPLRETFVPDALETTTTPPPSIVPNHKIDPFCSHKIPHPTQEATLEYLPNIAWKTPSSHSPPSPAIPTLTTEPPARDATVSQSDFITRHTTPENSASVALNETMTEADRLEAEKIVHQVVEEMLGDIVREVWAREQRL